MNTTPKDRDGVQQQLAAFNPKTATEDAILLGVVRMEYYRIPYGPDAVKKRFPAFYAAAEELFGDWSNVLRRAGIRVCCTRYFEPLPHNAALCSSDEYIKAVTQFLSELRAFRGTHTGRLPVVTLPIFHDDTPLVMTKGRFLREWVAMNYQFFRDLFNVPGIPRAWYDPRHDDPPDYFVRTSYDVNYCLFRRIIVAGAIKIRIDLYEIPHGNES